MLLPSTAILSSAQQFGIGLYGNYTIKTNNNNVWSEAYSPVFKVKGMNNTLGGSVRAFINLKWLNTGIGFDYQTINATGKTRPIQSDALYTISFDKGKSRMNASFIAPHVFVNGKLKAMNNLDVYAGLYTSVAFMVNQEEEHIAATASIIYPSIYKTTANSTADITMGNIDRAFVYGGQVGATYQISKFLHLNVEAGIRNMVYKTNTSYVYDPLQNMYYGYTGQLGYGVYNSQTFKVRANTLYFPISVGINLIL
ncbi:MAG: hypothetical protein JST82_05235 [Bacteroidetes bacterium]|nr:hypothetical protein [Bacteroidota bacterium]